MRYTRFLPLALAGAALLGACADAPTGLAPTTPPEAPGGAPTVLGLMEITISGIGTPQMSATATPVSGGAAIAAPGGARLAMTPTPSNSIQLRRVSATTVDVGSRASGGQRYIQAVFEVRNADATTGTGYATPRRNLTFVPVGTASSISGTAVARFLKQDGTAADPALAVQLRPTGAVALDRSGSLAPQHPDVLQLFSESEAAAFPVAAGTNPFPYGFVVRHVTQTNTRTLQANPPADLWEGRVTFAFRVPLAPTAPQDAFSITMSAVALDDSDTRVTQSLEEQTPAGQAAFQTRAALLGATRVSLLPGGAYTGTLVPRRLCGIRIAGSPGAVQSALTDCPRISSAAITPLQARRAVGMAEQFRATVLDENRAALATPPIHWSSSNPAVATVDDGGVVTYVGAGTATITVDAMGFTASASVVAEEILERTVSAGGSHTCGLVASGAAYCWGTGDSGQLGNGALLSSETPVAVAGGHTFKSISAGSQFTVALTTAGQAYTWGRDAEGQLGNDAAYASMSSPVPVAGNLTFRAVSAGPNSAGAVTTAGAAYTWGALGAPVPTAVPGGFTFKTIEAGGGFFVALTPTGAAYAWGLNNVGQLGDGTTTDRWTPAFVAGLRRFVTVSAGYSHTVGITSSGAAYTWGGNYFGALGNGSSAARSLIPVSVPGTFAGADAGEDFTIAYTHAGSPWAWGKNISGQLGDGTTIARSSPVPVVTNQSFVSVSAGSNHAVALTSTGSLHGWGDNLRGKANSSPALNGMLFKTP